MGRKQELENAAMKLRHHSSPNKKSTVCYTVQPFANVRSEITYVDTLRLAWLSLSTA